jgi:hypothetical protein
MCSTLRYASDETLHRGIAQSRGAIGQPTQDVMRSGDEMAHVAIDPTLRRSPLETPKRLRTEEVPGLPHYSPYSTICGHIKARRCNFRCRPQESIWLS